MSSNYQNITLNYIDGHFVTGFMYIVIEHDGKKICDQFTSFRELAPAMTALRQLEKLTGRVATMTEKYGHEPNGHHFRYCEKHLVYHEFIL